MFLSATLKEILLYADEIISMKPKTSPAVQRGVVDVAISPLKLSGVVKTTVDEQALKPCTAMESPDIDLHLPRVDEIEARPRFDRNSPLSAMPVHLALAGCNAKNDDPNGSDYDGFQSSPGTELRRIQIGLKAPPSLRTADNSTMTNSAVFSSMPSLIAGPALSSEKRPTILVVDDEPLYLDLIADILGADYKILVADEGMAGLEIATSNVPQLILLDLMMPGIDGFEVYKCLKADSRTCEIPVIFITGAGNVATETKGLKMGAVDYINKPINPDLVRARVNTQINFKLMRDKLVMLAATDGLTGLANRSHFDGMLAYEYARHLRSGKELSLIMLDVDHFKAFNDTYGHISGDETLREIARAMTRTVTRATDLVARYGGEEFVVLLPETCLRGALTLAERIRNCIGDLALPHRDTSAGRVTASLGVVSGSFLDGSSIVDVLAQADIQLYAAKAGGRNRVAFRAIEKPGQTH
jgi:diguanylate cyclase (GGDEF)-like protein